jgi:hypothetical protein
MTGQEKGGILRHLIENTKNIVHIWTVKQRHRKNKITHNVYGRKTLIYTFPEELSISQENIWSVDFFL